MLKGGRVAAKDSCGSPGNAEEAAEVEVRRIKESSFKRIDKEEMNRNRSS
jgi:hypothetical protein